MISYYMQVKTAMEQAFDIPFSVFGGYQGGDPWFEISPENGEQALFKLNIKFKEATRVIIDFVPERYSASMITDMSKASLDKKLLFKEFADFLQTKKKANIDFFINGIKQDPVAPDIWPNTWESIKCRITRSPVTREDEIFDIVSLSNEWAGNVLAMFLSLIDVVPIENACSENIIGQIEGTKYSSQTNRYERNPLNRRLCIEVKGTACSICGFSFKSTYGELGNGYIEVHHIEPLSNLRKEKIIDPIKDLTPVCSNCHSMLHRKNPPFLPEELWKIIKDSSGKSIDFSHLLSK